MAVSFKADVVSLFTSMDIAHMKAHGVLLDDYAYMSQPAHASRVVETVSTGIMPPSDSGEPAWLQDQIKLFGMDRRRLPAVIAARVLA